VLFAFSLAEVPIWVINLLYKAGREQRELGNGEGMGLESPSLPIRLHLHAISHYEHLPYNLVEGRLSSYLLPDAVEGVREIVAPDAIINGVRFFDAYLIHYYYVLAVPAAWVHLRQGVKQVLLHPGKEVKRVCSWSFPF